MSADPAATRLLIVDDQQVIRELLEMTFDGPEWDVTTLASAEEAMAAIERAPYDIYICDKNLPGISGVELIQWVRERDSIAGILLITGFSSISSALDTLHEGIDAYIEKPFDVDEIVAAAFTALGRCHQRREQAENAQTQLTIVVASADGPSLDWLRDRLSRGGDQVKTVVASKQVLESVDDAKPDLVILDAALQDPPVALLIEKIVGTHSQATLAIVNDNPSLEDVVTYISMGIRVVLKMPLSDEDFDEKVGGLLRALRAD